MQVQVEKKRRQIMKIRAEGETKEDIINKIKENNIDDETRQLII